jgi:hypothetical protein
MQEDAPTVPLPRPAVYTPFARGVYTVRAGLHGLDKPFGNQDIDGQVFQLDDEFERYRENLEEARADRWSKYYGVLGEGEAAVSEAVSVVLERLATEHADYFRLEKAVGGGQILRCVLTGDTLTFDSQFRLSDGDSLPYESAFDSVASQIQEDLAVVQFSEDDDRLVAAHVAAPSYWDPSEKIGKDFEGIHGPVPEMNSANRNAVTVMRTVINGPPYQRFNWSITTDRRLNHHPEAPEAYANDSTSWYGRSFDPTHPELYVRVERQTLVGLPRTSSILFGIRTYFTDCASLAPDHREALRAGLLSMSEATRVYKGLAERFDAIMDWLAVG